MSTFTDKSMWIRVPSVPAYLPVIRAATEKICGLLGFDERAAGAIVLSVDEALTNIIRHAYHGACDKLIELEFTPVGEEGKTSLQIRIRDYGEALDPAQLKPRDLADLKPGGLGLHIIAECMDRLEYSPAEGGGTLLTMIKDLPTNDEAKTK